MFLDLMHALNYFAITWIFVSFLILLLNSIFSLNLGRKVFRVSMIVSLFAVTIFAFNYKPTIFTDLYRHYQTLDLIRFSGHSFYNPSEIVTSMLYELVAATPYNQMLPFITTIIRYGLFFSVIVTFLRKYNYSYQSYQIFLFYFFAFFPLIESISGVRYYLAITLLFYALIKEYIFCSKSLLFTYLNYLISVLVHMSASLFIGIRLLLIGRIYKIIRPYRYLILLWTFLSNFIANVLSQISIPLTQSISKLLMFYINENREISLRLTIARFVLILTLMAMFYLIKYKEKNAFEIKKNYYNYFEIVMLFTLGSVFHDVFFQRGVFFTVIISLPIILDFLNSTTIRNNTKLIFKTILIILSIGMFANQIYGILYGYM